MARAIGSVCKLCRREQMKLFLKGERCLTDKCAVNKRPFPPGEHGKKQRKGTDYGIQLREKQRAKRIYGLLETQFRRYYEIGSKQKGKTGDNLLKLLERRLDNVVYRLNFATSRREARQLVRHRHIEVNGRIVDIPSYLLKPDDIISVKEKSKNLEPVKRALEATITPEIPVWLERNMEKLNGTVLSLPSREEIDLPIKEHLIVELYSK